MRLGYLLEQCLAPVPGGTGRYSRDLARALAARLVVVGVTAWHRDPAAARVAGVSGPRRLPLPRRALVAAWERGLGPSVPGDVVHAPTPLAPPRRRAPLVVTVHDAVPWTHPETLTPRGVRWHRAVVGRAARDADLLVVPTQAVAEELRRHVRAERLLVVGEGVSPDLAVPPDADERAARLDLPERYLLTVATLEPRKGLAELVAALPAAGLPLLVAGQPGWGGVRLTAPPGAEVRVLGRVSDPDLAVLLSRAHALVVPSRAEGFGLPLLEGMALGTPVLTSTAPRSSRWAGAPRSPCRCRSSPTVCGRWCTTAPCARGCAQPARVGLRPSPGRRRPTRSSGRTRGWPGARRLPGGPSRDCPQETALSGPRVLLDATAVPADRGGVGRYVDALVAALAHGGADLSLVCQRADSERYGRLAPEARVVPAPAAVAHRPARLAWEQTGLPLVASQVDAQVVHSPHYTVPLRAGRPVVVTLHDATFFTEPDMHSPVKGTFFRSATRTALRRAARAVVPSEATRSELVRVLAADPRTIDVAPHGVDAEAFHVPSEDEKHRVQSRLGLGEQPYVAFLSTLEPRKNVPGLVRGWVRACEGRTDPPALVLAGGAGWDDTIDAVLADVPPELRVLRPGYLRVNDLRGYLGGAVVVAYPSFGEGFGLPVLEAMACGAPVLTTRRLSLPEVGGDAVAYTEPDAEAIGTALAALLDDAAERERLAAAGRARAERFTWQASAEAHLRAYAAAAAGA